MNKLRRRLRLSIRAGVIIKISVVENKYVSSMPVAKQRYSFCTSVRWIRTDPNGEPMRDLL
jgi:hypothetical protein